MSRTAALDTGAPPPVTSKELRKLERQQDTRHLDPWERYRALCDVVDTYSELLDQADRKTRFALVIMGLLNAVNFLLVARSDVLGVGRTGPLVPLYSAVYAFTALYFFTQAIAALRPRSARFFRDTPSPGHHGSSQRLRSMAHVAQQAPEAYYEFWQHAQIGQLCREVAFTAQAMAAINMEKYRALERVYAGLVALTALTACLLTGLAWAGLHR